MCNHIIYNICNMEQKWAEKNRVSTQFNNTKKLCKSYKNKLFRIYSKPFKFNQSDNTRIAWAKKEFETAKESLKSMATSISHDFRTPLTSISGYMQLLLDDNNISQEDKIKYLNIVKNRSMSLSALVEDFYP